MDTKEEKWVRALVLSGCLLLWLASSPWAAGPVIIDHDCTDLRKIPHAAIEEAKNSLHIAYGHTSHGSQLIAGMGGSNGAGLDNFLVNSPKYDIPAGLYVWRTTGH